MIETIPPFLVEIKSLKIDEFINISFELTELIKQPSLSQIILSEFISFNSIFSKSVSIKLEFKSVILYKNASFIINFDS